MTYKEFYIWLNKEMQLF